MISLSRVGQFTLIQGLFKHVDISQGVYDEVTLNSSPHQPLQIDSFPWVTVHPNPNTIPIEVSRLGRGESTAIALCLEKAASVLIVDDLQARRVAERLSIRCVGTLRILRMSKEKGLIGLARPILDQLLLADFRVSRLLQTQFLSDVGEL